MLIIDYSRALLGFVRRDDSITSQDWFAYASQRPTLRKQPPHTGTDPFTRRPRAYLNANFYVVDGEEIIGLAVREDVGCVGVAGDGDRLRPFIDAICRDLGGVFESLDRL